MFASTDQLHESAQTDERERRAVQTQLLFREVNERVAALTGLSEGTNQAELRTEWVCECADPACRERLQLSVEEYEALREHPARFVVFPRLRHVSAEAERVVAYTDRSWTVEKIEVGRPSPARPKASCSLNRSEFSSRSCRPAPGSRRA